MKIRNPLAALVLVAAALPAWAGEKEPVTLSDGVTAMVEVVSTTADSVTVKIRKEGVEAQKTVAASRLDPISFYEVRRRNMESTPENHVRLAVWCADNGMLNQARFQMETARALDPEIDQKIKERPEVVNKIAQHLADAAMRMIDKGEIEKAKDLAQILATRFADTAAAARAGEALDRIEAKIAEAEGAEAAARQKKIQDEKDATAKAEAESREKVLAGLQKDLDAARKRESRALRDSNTNNAKNGHEEAAAMFEKLVVEIGSVRSSAGTEEFAATLAKLEEKVRKECADCWINAGSVLLPRSQFKEAEEYGKKALAASPGYGRATAFLESVEMAYEQHEAWEDLQDARARRRGR